MSPKSPLTRLLSFIVIISIVFGVSITHVELVYAGVLSSLSDTLTSSKVSQLADHTIQFVTPTGVSAGQQISITFPLGWTIGALATTSIDFATSTSGTCSGFADALLNNAAATLTWGVATTTTSITFTSGTAVIPANRCIQIKLGGNAAFQGTGTTTITNPSSATSSVLLIAGNFGDTGSITVNIVTNDTVSISATVDQSLTFVISTTTIYFGSLNSGSAKFASSTNTAGDTSETIAHTVAVTTNAAAGYTITIRGQTLTSQQYSSGTIAFIGAAAASSTPGTEQFGMRATSTGGTGAVVDPTFSALTSYGYDGTATTSTIFATGNAPTNQTTFGIRYIANIAGTTEASNYVANLVYVATANF